MTEYVKNRAYNSYYISSNVSITFRCFDRWVSGTGGYGCGSVFVQEREIPFTIKPTKHAYLHTFIYLLYLLSRYVCIWRRYIIIFVVAAAAGGGFIHLFRILFIFSFCFAKNVIWIMRNLEFWTCFHWIEYFLFLLSS